jgi:hypothetical protein
VSEKRHFWNKKDTFIVTETLLKEKRHFSRRGDFFGGKETPVSA